MYRGEVQSGVLGSERERFTLELDLRRALLATRDREIISLP
jgi:hypothetical protein